MTLNFDLCNSYFPKETFLSTSSPQTLQERKTRNVLNTMAHSSKRYRTL